MTRKDYIKVADMLAGEFALARHDNTVGAVAALRNVTFGIADIFAQDNPRFDRQRFYTAAGLEV